MGEGTADFKHVCVCFGGIFKWAPLGICHAGRCRPLSPDTVTAPRKMPPVVEFKFLKFV